MRAEVIEAASIAKEKISLIYQSLHENALNTQTDEGFLEMDLQSYDRCYHLDYATLTAYLDIEHARLEKDY